MAFCRGKKPPTATDPVWLRNSGVRVDEFGRQAVLASLPEPPPFPEDSEGDVHRRRLLTSAGTGLNYEAVAAKSSPSELAAQTLAFKRSMAASFAPQRHVFFVLGRPCVVPRRKNNHSLFLAAMHPEPTSGSLLEQPMFSREKRIVILLTQPESTARLVMMSHILLFCPGTCDDPRVVQPSRVQRLLGQGGGSSDSFDGAWPFEGCYSEDSGRPSLVVCLEGPLCVVVVVMFVSQHSQMILSGGRV